jgi:chromosome segregation ATPase
MNNIEKQLKELRQQIIELDDRVADLEHKDDRITVYEALYLLNSEDLEKNLKSLLARIKELTMKLGRVEITISDTP